MTARFIVGDVREVMASLPDGSVDLVFTSPPFLHLRSYLPDDDPRKQHEIGHEPTPAEFLDTLLDLSAEWRRLLAPHGTLAVELGDTYSGSGGAGGDYDPDGLRDGQPVFTGSASAARSDDEARRGVDQRNRGNTSTGTPAGGAWPLGKSLTFIPSLYGASLAYGRNLLSCGNSPAGRWRVRNLVAWCRPNPPVGDLGDKFRPGTSYITVACTAADRWFDLDAVRTPHTKPGAVKRKSKDHSAANPSTGWAADNAEIHQNPAGAPPLDWWEIPPGGYKGAHYAVFPPRLVERPVDAMCPRRVCRTCGTPSRRIVAAERVMLGRLNPGWKQARSAATGGGDMAQGAETSRTTVGWSSCGCPGTGEIWADGADDLMAEIDDTKRAARRRGVTRAERERIRDEVLPPLYDRLADHYLGRADGFHDGPGWRPGVVLDPFAGSGTTLYVATGRGRDAIGIDLDPRNADLARERVGMFLDVDDSLDRARVRAAS